MSESNYVTIYRFGKHYEIPLLAQSIIMLFAMMALVHLCVHVRRKTEIIVAKQHKFTGKVSIRLLLLCYFVAIQNIIFLQYVHVV